jgi:hypothetical protein
MREELVLGDLNSSKFYIFVHVVLEKVGAGASPMSVKNSEVTTFGPSSFVVWFCNVHDDRDSIFIVVLNQAMESVDSIAFDVAVAFFDEMSVVYLGDFGDFLRLEN